MNANVTSFGSNRPAFSTLGMIHLAGDLLARWRRRHADRHHLATLDDFMLSDIGLARADVELEVSKPFWRA